MQTSNRRPFQPSNTQNTAMNNQHNKSKVKNSNSIKQILNDANIISGEINIVIRKAKLLLDIIKDKDPELTGGKLKIVHFNPEFSDREALLNYDALQKKIEQYQKKAVSSITKMINYLSISDSQKSSMEWKSSFDVVYSCLDENLSKISFFHKNYPPKIMLLWNDFYDPNDIEVFAKIFITGLNECGKDISFLV